MHASGSSVGGGGGVVGVVLVGGGGGTVPVGAVLVLPVLALLPLLDFDGDFFVAAPLVSSSSSSSSSSSLPYDWGVGVLHAIVEATMLARTKAKGRASREVVFMLASSSFAAGLRSVESLQCTRRTNARGM